MEEPISLQASILLRVGLAVFLSEKSWDFVVSQNPEGMLRLVLATPDEHMEVEAVDMGNGTFAVKAEHHPRIFRMFPGGVQE